MIFRFETIYLDQSDTLKDKFVIVLLVGPRN